MIVLWLNTGGYCEGWGSWFAGKVFRVVGGWARQAGDVVVHQSRVLTQGLAKLDCARGSITRINLMPDARPAVAECVW